MSALNSHPKIAIVYDSLTTEYGGAEVVLRQLHQIYPEAPLFTTISTHQKLPWSKSWQIRSSFLQAFPDYIRRRHRLLAPVLPMAVEMLDLNPYDIIISVSAGVAKGVLSKPNQLHVCYLLSPTRYLYHTQPLEASRWLQLPGLKQLAGNILSYLRWWDQAAAQRPDRIIAISSLVAGRIKRTYHRSVECVLYPPYQARNDRNTNLPELGAYSIVVSRLVWYKNVQLAVAGAVRCGQRLLVVGSGPYQTELITAAGELAAVRASKQSLAAFLKKAIKSNAQILFCQNASDTEVADLIVNANCLLMLGVEDYGMTAVEATALGTPVIWNAASGAGEVLRDGIDGISLARPTASRVTVALQAIQSMNVSYHLLKTNALRYSDTVFRRQFATTINRLWRQHQKEANV